MRAADAGLERGDAGADELDHPATLRTDEVIVLLAGVDVLEEVALRGESLLADEAASHQELEVTVDRGARDRRAAGLHRRQDLLGINVAVLAVDLVEEVEPLVRDA